VWFSLPGSRPDPVAACTRIQLRPFGPGHLAPAPEPGVVTLLEEAAEPVRDTFSAFAEKLATEGFAFLHAQMRQANTGPVLSCVQDGRVAGAIGPMEIRADSLGAARLLRQYFGVLPEHRGAGYGRALWRAAMHWGHQHGAAYQLLQTQADGASDRLCRTEGLPTSAWCAPAPCDYVTEIHDPAPLTAKARAFRSRQTVSACHRNGR
jgi:GNAT superfamily N-acetyltransferase